MRGELPSDQSQRNIDQARRVMALVPETDFNEVNQAIDAGQLHLAARLLAAIPVVPSPLIPAPIIIIRAEIANAIRYA